MAKINKFYAVRNGKKKGIFNSWEETKPLVTNYADAEYTAFSTKAEANAYINGEEVPVGVGLSKDAVIMYTDGSYDKNDINKRSSTYAFLAIRENVILYKENGYTPRENEGLENVSGELTAVERAVEWAVSAGYKKIIIRHDLEHDEKLASGSEQPHNKATKHYVEFIKDYRENKQVEISFEKVDAHTNDEYNDIVDKMAKEALKQI